MAITNLSATYSYPANATNLPILIAMHSYGSTVSFPAEVTARMAAYGCFVISPLMRGRGITTGSPDSSGRELMDIYDAITYARTNFAARVSTTRCGIVGYSGGGGNALGMAAKFPDLFEVVVDHFGISDYGVQANPAGWWPSTNETWVGGTPTSNPNAYAARDHHTAVATNYSGGHLWLYHDQSDPTVNVVQTTQVRDAMIAAGRTNYEISITSSSDTVRWSHGNPQIGDSGAPNIGTEVNWCSALASGAYPAWTIPTSGTVDVRGYMITKRFEIWLGTTTRAGAGGGLDEVASVTYDTAAHTYTVTPSTSPTNVFIKQGSLTGSATSISGPTLITVA